MPMNIKPDAFTINLLYICYILFHAQSAFGFPQIQSVAGGSVSGGHVAFNQSISNDENVAMTRNNTANSVSSHQRSFRFNTADFVIDGGYDILDFYPGFTKMGLDLLAGYLSLILSTMQDTTVIHPGSYLIIYNFPLRVTLDWSEVQDGSWTAELSALAMEELHGKCPTYFKDHLRTADARISHRPAQPKDQLNLNAIIVYERKPVTLPLSDGFELLVEFAPDDMIPFEAAVRALSACYSKYQKSKTIPAHSPDFFHENGAVIGFYVFNSLPSEDPLPTAILFNAIGALRQHVRFHRQGRWTGLLARLTQYKSEVAELSMSPFQMAQAATF